MLAQKNEYVKFNNKTNLKTEANKFSSKIDVREWFAI